jgi:hypothetical protein
VAPGCLVAAVPLFLSPHLERIVDHTVSCGQAVDGKALLALQAMRVDDGGGGFARFVKDFVGVESAGAALGLAWQVCHTPSHLIWQRRTSLVVRIARSHTQPALSFGTHAWADRSGGMVQLTQPLDPPPPPGARTAVNHNVPEREPQREPQHSRTLDVAQTSVLRANITSGSDAELGSDRSIFRRCPFRAG